MVRWYVSNSHSESPDTACRKSSSITTAARDKHDFTRVTDATDRNQLVETGERRLTRNVMRWAALLKIRYWRSRACDELPKSTADSLGLSFTYKCHIVTSFMRGLSTIRYGSMGRGLLASRSRITWRAGLPHAWHAVACKQRTPPDANYVQAQYVATRDPLRLEPQCI